MNLILLLILFIITGIVTGIIAGMLGIGGGTIFVPVLYTLLPLTFVNNNQLTYIVIGTSLFCIAVASFSSGTNHYLSKNVNLKLASLLAIGSIISSFLTVFFVIKVKPLYLQYIFVIIFLLIAVKMFFGKDNSNKNDSASKKTLNIYSSILFGFVVGIFSAFTGLGGGVLFVPILIYLFGLKTKTAIGTSSLAIFATATAAAVSYGFPHVQGDLPLYQFGYVNLLAGIPIGLGAVFGAYIGVKITLKTRSEKLRRYFSILLLIVIVKIAIGILH